LTLADRRLAARKGEAISEVTGGARYVVNIRIGLVLLTSLVTAHAAELKPEALIAWQEYGQSAIARMQERTRPDSHFLRIEQDQDWVKEVRNGEILTSPGDSQSVKKVPSGLIHDWFGAIFIEHATINDVLSVVRDYDRYKEFYRPSVLDSRTLAKGGREDRFSMVLMNKAAFLKTALYGDYQCSYVRVTDRRWYSISETTRLQEVEDYGAPSQHALPDGEGNGYLWRLLSIARFEERDGGVYIEMEVVALSRDIPISLRWLVEPIVHRVSKISMAASLRQTQAAIGSEVTLADSASRLETSSSLTQSLSRARALVQAQLVH
jgi:hypothetical protein